MGVALLFMLNSTLEPVHWLALKSHVSQQGRDAAQRSAAGNPKLSASND
jgi:hypothetical protein